jgi:hypothetical protein
MNNNKLFSLQAALLTEKVSLIVKEIATKL